MNVVFAIAIYIGASNTAARAMIDPTSDNVVAAVIAMVCVTYTLQRRITSTEMDDMKKALVAARKQLADQNMLLRAMREAVNANDLEPIRAYWRARGH